MDLFSREKETCHQVQHNDGAGDGADDDGHQQLHDDDGDDDGVYDGADDYDHQELHDDDDDDDEANTDDDDDDDDDDEEGYGDLGGLHEDLLEEILWRLPLQSSIAASVVCKRWHFFLSPPRRLLLGQHLISHRPWFFFTGVNHFLAAKNQAFGFDPETWRWHRFRSFQLPPYDQGSLTGTHGLLFALAGTGICKLGFTTSLFKNSSWRETPPLQVSRRSPIVAIIRNPNPNPNHKHTRNPEATRSFNPILYPRYNLNPTTYHRFNSHSNPGSGLDGSGGGGSFHLVVAGGKAMDDQLVVEIYDSQQDAWRPCAPLPHQFRLLNTSQWMRSTVFEGKFIVYETDTGLMAYLDIDTLQWSNTFLLKPEQRTVYSFLIACGSRLILIGLVRINNDGHRRFKVWLVNFPSLECIEIGYMPHEIYSIFDEDEDDEVKDPVITCVGGGDFIYMYSDSWHKDYATCICDVSGGKVIWRKMPHLPAPVNRFDKVVCFSSLVMEDMHL